MFNNDLLMKNLYEKQNNQNQLNEIEMPTATLPNKTVEKNNDPVLYNPVEGYMRGNLFTDLYSQYKNYSPSSLNPKDEKEKLFLKLSETSFAAHELNLYLDINPSDNSMIALFNDYRKRANKLISEYEQKYGVLTIGSDALNSTPWMWTVQEWPWEGGNK